MQQPSTLLWGLTTRARSLSRLLRHRGAFRERDFWIAMGLRLLCAIIGTCVRQIDSDLICSRVRLGIAVAGKTIGLQDEVLSFCARPCLWADF